MCKVMGDSEKLFLFPVYVKTQRFIGLLIWKVLFFWREFIHAVSSTSMGPNFHGGLHLHSQFTSVDHLPKKTRYVGKINALNVNNK